MTGLLRQPEYVHLLLNPVLTHTLPAAAVGLLIASLSRSRPVQRAALIFVLASAAFIVPVVHYGERGEDRVTAMADNRGGEWLAIHVYRAERFEWLFYAVAIGALAALVLPVKWPRSAAPLLALALVLAVAACFAAAYVAFPAGKVRHRELRNGPPPPVELERARAST